jgi:hypothetical protein
LRAYREGISETFGLKVDHVAKYGINKPHADNNRIERLNGTLRESQSAKRLEISHVSNSRRQANQLQLC